MIIGFDAGGKMQSEKISDCFPNQEMVNDAVSLTSETVFDWIYQLILQALKCTSRVSAYAVIY